MPPDTGHRRALARRGVLAASALPVLAAPFLGAPLAQAQPVADPLPSWRDGPRKRALLDFVAAVTTAGSPAFVPPPARIATFDNDGCLWVEQPAYTQLIFILDRLRALAPRNPAWQQDALFRAAIAGDLRAAASGGTEGLLRLAGAAQAGNTPEEFQRIATECSPRRGIPAGTGPTPSWSTSR